MSPNFRRTAGVVLCICSAAGIAGVGCSSHMKYPQSWQAIPDPPDRTCQQVVGTYRDNGERGEASPGRYSLAQHLTGEGQTLANPSAEYVTLSFPHVGELQALVSGPDGRSSFHLYTAESGQYACRGGLVIIKKRASWNVSGTGTGGAGRSAEALELRSNRNHLIVKSKENTFMLVGFVLPATYRESEWYRFERYERQP